MTDARGGCLDQNASVQGLRHSTETGHGSQDSVSHVRPARPRATIRVTRKISNADQDHSTLPLCPYDVSRYTKKRETSKCPPAVEGSVVIAGGTLRRPSRSTEAVTLKVSQTNVRDTLRLPSPKRLVNTHGTCKHRPNGGPVQNVSTHNRVGVESAFWPDALRRNRSAASRDHSDRAQTFFVKLNPSVITTSGGKRTDYHLGW